MSRPTMMISPWAPMIRCWRTKALRTAETRETKDGRQIMHIKMNSHRISHVDWARYNLFGVLPTDIWDVLSFGLQNFRSDGPAPMGPNERAVLEMPK